MRVTAAEFKSNMEKYLEIVSREDVFITRNGKIVAQVTNPQTSAVASLRGLLKDAPSDLDRTVLREERLSEHENHV